MTYPQKGIQPRQNDHPKRVVYGDREYSCCSKRRATTLLCEFVDEALHIIESCGPCSGNSPSSPTIPGATSSAGESAGGPGPEGDQNIDDPGNTDEGLLSKVINSVFKTKDGQMTGPFAPDGEAVPDAVEEGWLS